MSAAAAAGTMMPHTLLLCTNVSPKPQLCVPTWFTLGSCLDKKNACTNAFTSVSPNPQLFPMCRTSLCVPTWSTLSRLLITCTMRKSAGTWSPTAGRAVAEAGAAGKQAQRINETPTPIDACHNHTWTSYGRHGWASTTLWSLSATPMRALGPTGCYTWRSCWA